MLGAYKIAQLGDFNGAFFITKVCGDNDGDKWLIYFSLDGSIVNGNIDWLMYQKSGWLIEIVIDWLISACAAMIVMMTRRCQTITETTSTIKSRNRYRVTHIVFRFLSIKIELHVHRICSTCFLDGKTMRGTPYNNAGETLNPWQGCIKLPNQGEEYNFFFNNIKWIGEGSWFGKNYIQGSMLRKSSIFFLMKMRKLCRKIFRHWRSRGTSTACSPSTVSGTVGGALANSPTTFIKI